VFNKLGYKEYEDKDGLLEEWCLIIDDFEVTLNEHETITLSALVTNILDRFRRDNNKRTNR
jgi:hypothetical protein